MLYKILSEAGIHLILSLAVGLILVLAGLSVLGMVRALFWLTGRQFYDPS